jgi:hypothetical protein
MIRRLLLAAALLCGLIGPAAPQGVLSVYGDYPNTTLTGTLTETLLVSVPIPANSLGPNGVARLTFAWGNSSSANNKTVTIHVTANPTGIVGGTVFTSIQTTNIASQTIATFRNHNATNLNGVWGGVTFGTTTNAPEGNTNLDTTALVYFNITGTLANVGDSITLTGWTLEIMRP